MKIGAHTRGIDCTLNSIPKSKRMKILNHITVTLATSEMLSHAPPTSEYFPSPILDKITEAESSGPTANGVCLRANNEKDLVILNYYQRQEKVLLQKNLASNTQRCCSVQLMRRVLKGKLKFFLSHRESSNK